MALDVSLAATSRYKDTLVYTEGGIPEFALFEPPPEFAIGQSGVVTHRVSQHEIGFLDLLAVRYYGHGYEQLWWVIALANGILDPELDMTVGQALGIPSRDAVIQFISRVGDASRR